MKLLHLFVVLSLVACVVQLVEAKAVDLRTSEDQQLSRVKRSEFNLNMYGSLCPDNYVENYNEILRRSMCIPYDEYVAGNVHRSGPDYDYE